MKETCIDEILSLELEMLKQEQTCGRCACDRMDRDLFSLLRASQLEAWGTQLLDSYLQDLRTAQMQGHNLLCEKYAYMLERTNPEEAACLGAALPERTIEKVWLVDWICAAHGEWQKELEMRYPRLIRWAGAVSSDSVGGFSADTMLYGELMTYSVETLRQYAAYAENLQKAERNLGALILQNVLARYGYRSLEEAEELFAGRTKTAWNGYQNAFAQQTRP